MWPRGCCDSKKNGGPKLKKYRLSLALWAILIAPVQAAELVVRDPWVRQPPPGAMATGGFAILENPSPSDVVITSARSDAAQWVELHRTINQNGVARMQEQKTLQIPAGGRLVLKPGGYHLMMMQPKKITAGDRIHISLRFADGTQQTFHAPVVRGLGGGKGTM